MKQFTDVRELIGQIGLDLDSRAGIIGSAFRDNIRKELLGLGSKDIINVSINQLGSGTIISLKIEDWVEELERNTIIEEFKDLMDRIGATISGACFGSAPGSLVAFLSKGGK
jgi:molybdopterin converting factor small subunit